MNLDRQKSPAQFGDLFGNTERFTRAISQMGSSLVQELNADYRPWRKVRHIAKARGEDPEITWVAVKLSRLPQWQEIPLLQANGKPFGFCLTPSMNERLHRIDQMTGGGGAALVEGEDGVLNDPSTRTRFVIRSLMDEAIESSRLEGAVVTREQATDLLRSGRTPRTSHEWMVFNNYAAMQRIKEWTDRPLTIDFLLELHRILTHGTLRHEAQGGRFRKPEERVAVVDDRTSETVYVPPPADGLSDRVQRICDFANTSHTGANFIHPIVKACILHFAIGYEHPFVDGNGRTARAVFYWMALRSGYRIFEFLVISELIRKAFAAYPQAYLDTELDDGDLTYFIRFKLRIINQALNRLSEYLHEEQEKITRSLRLARLDPDLNLRQRILLEHALRHPKTVYTVRSHANSNRIASITARQDLEYLVRRGLMNTFRVRREVHYVPAPDLMARLGSTEPAHPKPAVEPPGPRTGDA